MATPARPFSRRARRGAAGFLSISLAVTYLLSVYPLIARKTALATALNQETAGRADGVIAAERYLAAGQFDALAERLRWLNDELLALGQGHCLYPVLFYVRPRVVHESFVRALAVTQGLVATLRYPTDAQAHPEIANDPWLLYTLHNLERSSHIATQLTPPGNDASSKVALGEALTALRADLSRGESIRVPTTPPPAVRSSASGRPPTPIFGRMPPPWTTMPARSGRRTVAGPATPPSCLGQFPNGFSNLLLRLSAAHQQARGQARRLP